MVIIVIVSVIILTYIGMNYYGISMDNRYFHANHEQLKPSGYLGHGYGIAGSLMIITGLVTYMSRKRFHWMSRMGYLKHWLEFHIFLCVLGPVFVIFHTSFKFGGIVAISFWSMIAVVLSGVIGRFIYIQIPRSVEGRELSLNELCVMKAELTTAISESGELGENLSELLQNAFKDRPVPAGKNLIARLWTSYWGDRKIYKRLKQELRRENLTRENFARACKLLESEITINRRIAMLQSMRSLMEYWHVAHLPFALAMLVVMLIHVGIVLVLGYRWVF
jgi:hypothetical protein